MTPELREEIIAKLLDPRVVLVPQLATYERRRALWHRCSAARESRHYRRLAPRLAREWRTRLALAMVVQLAARGVDGVSIGMAREARWSTLNSRYDVWTVRPAAGEPGRKARARKAETRRIRIPPETVALLLKARDVRDGLNLLAPGSPSWASARTSTCGCSGASRTR